MLSSSSRHLWPSTKHGKLEFLQHSSITPGVASLDVGNTTISSSSNAICLRVAWSHDLSPTVNISNNLAKARRAVFEQQANGIAYGKQNPLTSRQLYSVCVHPVCLYSSESWLLRESTLATLEKFQGDHGKKILNIPKHHSNLIPLVALKWPTMRLCRKNTRPLIIQQCKFLEKLHGTHFTPLTGRRQC